MSNIFEKHAVKISRILVELDQKLDLVLILEKYDESIILLKEALNLSFEEVINFKLNSAITNHKKVNLDSQSKWAQNKFINLASQNIYWLDTKIYDYFYKLFMRKLYNYGEEKMQNQVGILKDHIRIMTEICGVTEVQPELESGDFSMFQKIPAEKIPYHNPFIKISTLLTNREKIEYYSTKYGYDPKVLNEICKMMTLPELKMAEYVSEWNKLG